MCSLCEERGKGGWDVGRSRTEGTGPGEVDDGAKRPGRSTSGFYGRKGPPFRASASWLIQTKELDQARIKLEREVGGWPARMGSDNIGPVAAAFTAANEDGLSVRISGYLRAGRGCGCCGGLDEQKQTPTIALRGCFRSN